MSAPFELAISALTTAEREAITSKWTRSRKTVHRLALMGFVKEWSHFTGLSGYRIVRTERGDDLAQSLNAAPAHYGQAPTAQVIGDSLCGKAENK